MINDEVYWAEWVDLLGITTESLHSISHGCEVDNSWNTSEVLQDDSSGLEGDFKVLL
jgi:hypothetical protein